MGNTSSQGTQEASGGNQQQGQESATGGSQGQESGTQQGSQQGQEQQGQEFSLENIQDPALKGYLERLSKDAQEARQEAARYRTERNQFQTQVSEFQKQNETDQQRAEREAQEASERLTALERENRDLKVGGAVRDAATKAKAFNPQLVAQMLTDRVELDDQGNPTNTADLLKDLRQSDPYLFRRVDQGAGEGTGQGAAPVGNMNDNIRAQIAARRGVK